jgi:hypothetical protein
MHAEISQINCLVIWWGFWKWWFPAFVYGWQKRNISKLWRRLWRNRPGSFELSAHAFVLSLRAFQLTCWVLDVKPDVVEVDLFRLSWFQNQSWTMVSVHGQSWVHILDFWRHIRFSSNICLILYSVVLLWWTSCHCADKNSYTWGISHWACL